MTVTLIEEKIHKIVAVCDTLLKTQTPTIRQVAAVIGILVFNFPGALYSPLNYRGPIGEKYLAFVANKGDYTGKM